MLGQKMIKRGDGFQYHLTKNIGLRNFSRRKKWKNTVGK